jgi:hypothetical protein
MRRRLLGVTNPGIENQYQSTLNQIVICMSVFVCDVE